MRRTEQARDLAGTTWPITGTGECLPRIFLGCLERQGNALAVYVNVEDLNGNLVATSATSDGWSMCFGQLGNVDEAVYATKVHERAVNDRGQRLTDLSF